MIPGRCKYIHIPAGHFQNELLIRTIIRSRVWQQGIIHFNDQNDIQDPTILPSFYTLSGSETNQITLPKEWGSQSCIYYVAWS